MPADVYEANEVHSETIRLQFHQQHLSAVFIVALQSPLL